MEKKYVNTEQIKDHIYDKHITIGCKVVIIDGSYMTDENKEPISGRNFVNNHLFEVLKVKRVNIPFKTNYDSIINHVLGHHNNCEIEGYDGKLYYCSLINIKRLSDEVSNRI
jgi:hypothetical protein